MIKNDSENPQVLYQGRWVSRNDFRAFVYNDKGQKLANSYKEYSDLIESGLWFSSKPEQPNKGRKPKHGANS